jgi:hypothetical protein
MAQWGPNQNDETRMTNDEEAPRGMEMEGIALSMPWRAVEGMTAEALSRSRETDGAMGANNIG